jgi:asparagine N-glycosylation enzyme membrane subunit Stt3
MAKAATRTGRKRHPVVVTLWALAAALLALGFVLRILAHFWIGWDLHLLGVEVIAGGLVLAFVAWLAERGAGLKPPPG